MANIDTVARLLAMSGGNGSGGSSAGFNTKIVESLPTTGETNTIYLVKKTGKEKDKYNEYLYVNNAWELVGSTGIDLTDYAKKSDITDITGDLSDLTTTNKANLVSAVNEINAKIGDINTVLATLTTPTDGGN